MPLTSSSAEFFQHPIVDYIANSFSIGILPTFAITKNNKTHLQISIIRLFTFTAVYRSNRSFALHTPSKSDRRKGVGGIRELGKIEKQSPTKQI